MMKMENRFTKLTLEQDDRKITWEVPYDDVTGEDMMQALRTIMIGMTFSEWTIESAMADYLREYAYDRYDIYDKDNNNLINASEIDDDDCEMICEDQ